MVKNILKPIFAFIMGSLYLAALAMFIVAPEYFIFNVSLLSVAVSISIGFCVKFRHDILAFFKSSFFLNGLTQFVSVILIFCILGVINYLVVKNDYFLDVTKQKIHTLSDQSIKAIELLQAKKINFKIFAPKHEWKRFLNLLNLYKNFHNELNVEAIDIQEDPALVTLYNVKEVGTLVVEVDGKRFSTIAKNELTVTNLLLKIANPNTLNLYHVVGHNELSLSDKNTYGGDFLSEKIRNSSYGLKPLDLSGGIPSDANALLILNPQIDFVETEVSSILKYIELGGSLFISVSPQFNGNMTPNFISLLDKLGVKYINGMVLDRLASQQGSQASIPVINNYAEHQILKDFEGRTLFPVSAFLKVNPNSIFEYKPIISTAPFPATWGEVDFEQVKSGRADYNEGIDFQGPLNIILAGESDKSRIVISGSTSFLTNQFQGQSNNFNLFLNALAWVVKDDALISLDRPELKGNIIYISEIHVSLIFYFAILIFPFTFFIAGIIAYRFRLSR